MLGILGKHRTMDEMIKCFSLLFCILCRGMFVAQGAQIHTACQPCWHLETNSSGFEAAADCRRMNWKILEGRVDGD